MLRYQRAQLPFLAAFIFVVLLFAGYFVRDSDSVQLQNHVLQIDRLHDRIAESRASQGESGSGSTAEESSTEDTPTAKHDPAAEFHEETKDAQGAPDSITKLTSLPGDGDTEDEESSANHDPNVESHYWRKPAAAPELAHKDNEEKDAGTPKDDEDTTTTPDPNTGSRIWRKPAVAPELAHKNADYDGAAPPSRESSTSTDTPRQWRKPAVAPEMGYKDATPKKPAQQDAAAEPIKSGWRRVGSRPQATLGNGKTAGSKPVKQKPPPIAKDSASYKDSRPSVDYDDFSKTVVAQTSAMDISALLSEARGSVSYDKTTAPSVGCEDVVAELQSMVIETYAAELKGIRYAHIFGLLDATENKGDAVIWVAQEILLATLGITTMQACRYIDKDCDVAAWRAGLVEYAPHSGIIMAGGGNFNDYFEDDHPARLRMVQEYGDRWPIRMFPQSVNMTTEKWTGETLQAFGEAVDVQLGARDLPSYEWLEKAFGRDDVSGGKVGDVRTTLSPDIAFMFGNRPDIRLNTPKTHDIYILARDDSEVSAGESSDVPLGVGVFDFGPEAGDVTYLKNDWRRVQTQMHGEHGAKQRNWAKAMHGFEILASAEFVITDRLHGHIMCTLMGIPHVLMDSKLKKNLFFHDTWTKDCDCVRVADNIEEAVEIAQLYFEKETKQGRRKKVVLNSQPKP